MTTTSSKRILIVGASSKIADCFVRACPKTYDVYGTYATRAVASLPVARQYKVDLRDSDQIRKFLHKVAGLTFDAVLFFAAKYAPDPQSDEDYFAVYDNTFQLNAASIVAIARGVSLAPRSKLFLFGDAGLTHPKEGFTAYSISKLAVADMARLLAIELAPDTATFCLRLGPTLKYGNGSCAKAYYRRALVKAERPVEGLVHLLHFLIAEPNFSATGCVIDYDGGAYLKRLR